MHAFALVEQSWGAHDVVPMVATNRDDADHGDGASDDDADEYARLGPLDLVSDLPKAAAYGWFMAGRDDCEMIHFTPSASRGLVQGTGL